MSNSHSHTHTSRGFLYWVGCAIAAYCSWTLNHSILWAVINGCFGWLYLLYLCAGFGGGLPNLPW